MGRTTQANKIKLTTSNVEENNIILQEISGQLYVNNHLVLTSNNIGDSSNITSIESDITTLQSDVSTLQNESSEGESSFSNQYSVELDGANDYMEIDTGSITLYGFSCWFKSDQAFSTSGGNFAVLLGQSGTSYFLALGGNITGDFTDELITIRASSQNSFAYTSAGGSIDTGWHHIVGAWSTSAATTGGNGYDIYLDGVKVGNAAGSATPSSPYVIGSSAFRIGQRQNGSYAFNGLIDEVSIFTSALSASDIATLYNSGLPGDISSLNPFGWWRMGDSDSGAGTTITDQGSGGNDGELINGPTFSSSTPS